MKRAIAALLWCVGCTSGVPDVPHDHIHSDTVSISQAVEQRFERDLPFQQVGVMFDSADPLQFRTSDAAWQDVPVTFREGIAQVGVIVLDDARTEIEFRSENGFSDATFQFYEEIIAPDRTETADVVRTSRLALAPEELVVRRQDWGARDPDKICGDAHTPERISIHHTALPVDDGGDAAARMRQMQAFHIDSNGWCDIGYHFVVAQSGVIYQGRSTELRTGAHVGNQNTNNIGICLIGDYQANVPDQSQLDRAAEMMSWVARTYDIPFNRDVIKGHGEWPGQTTSCPGQNTLAVFDQLIADAEALVVGPADPCPALGAKGGEIDDASPCFRAFGPGSFWREEAGGIGGSFRWTNALQTDAPSNYARWNVNVTTPGVYSVEYHSVAEFALFNSARYGISHNAAEENVTIDLSSGVDGWNVIGEFEFAAGEDQWIAVYDDTALPVEDDQHIIADAIRLTLVDGDVDIDPNDQNNDTTDDDDELNNDDDDEITGDEDPFAQVNANDIRVNDGCATGGAVSSPWWLLLGLFAWSRRRD